MKAYIYYCPELNRLHECMFFEDEPPYPFLIFLNGFPVFEYELIGEL